MKTKDFNKIVVARLKRTKEVLTSKGDAYATDDGDRLSAFHTAARINGESSFKALQGMEVKHTVSIMDCIHRMSTDSTYVPTREWVAEKLGDKINYTLLLEGLIEERREELHEAIDV